MSNATFHLFLGFWTRTPFLLTSLLSICHLYFCTLYYIILHSFNCSFVNFSFLTLTSLHILCILFASLIHSLSFFTFFIFSFISLDNSSIFSRLNSEYASLKLVHLSKKSALALSNLLASFANFSVNALEKGIFLTWLKKS